MNRQTDKIHGYHQHPDLEWKKLEELILLQIHLHMGDCHRSRGSQSDHPDYKSLLADKDWRRRESPKHILDECLESPEHPADQ